MRLTRQEAEECKALVIDSNPTSRSILMNMLRDIGIGQVSQTSRVTDARRELENCEFDIVLCDYHFDNSPMSGQDLLDDLRRSQLLPYATVFVMVTGECSYTKVAEAAESALDSYLIKPHAASALEERVLQARHRKKVLRSIFKAIEAGDFANAARLCLERYHARAEFWLYAARIGAELFLRVGDPASARALYQSVHDARGLAWAKLGLARAELAAGQMTAASTTLESLIEEQPGYADAHDVMGRVQVEQGQLGDALDTFRTAATITPHSITRLQKQGMLAFFLGQTDEATTALERSVRLGVTSKMFDCQSLVLLAMMQFDKRDAKELGRVVANLALALERQSDSPRLQRLFRVAGVLQALQARRVGDCVSGVRELAADIRCEDFDHEAATNLLAVLARLRQSEVKLEEAEAWVTEIAQRYCVSKASCEVLCGAAANDEVYAALIHEGQHGISSMAEKAMAHSLSGSPAVAVESLMAKGLETLNAKLIELAAAVLHRHAAKITDHAALAGRINELKTRYCSQGTQVSLGQVSSRSAGGLTLRA
jgi:CheY-like chemotaxis protein